MSIFGFSGEMLIGISIADSNQNSVKMSEISKSSAMFNHKNTLFYLLIKLQF